MKECPFYYERACFKTFQPEVFAYLFNIKEGENFNHRNT
jgi:hypothetical protein